MDHAEVVPKVSHLGQIAGVDGDGQPRRHVLQGPVEVPEFARDHGGDFQALRESGRVIGRLGYRQRTTCCDRGLAEIAEVDHRPHH